MIGGFIYKYFYGKMPCYRAVVVLHTTYHYKLSILKGKYDIVFDDHVNQTKLGFLISFVRLDGCLI